MPRVPRATLSQIEELLVAEIPKAVKAANITEPVYCLRIWYNGTDSDEDAIPWLLVVKESVRKGFITKYGKKAPYYIWCADEATDDGQSFTVHLENSRLSKLYRKWYDYLAEAEEEEEALQPFREMLQSVSRRLNGLRWQELAPVTDDFVVFPADGAHLFLDDEGDLLASVTPEQASLLTARKLIPIADDSDE